jgi:hypothetical protein
MNSLLGAVCPCIPVLDCFRLWGNRRGLSTLSTERIQVTSRVENDNENGTDDDMEDASVHLLKESREGSTSPQSAWAAVNAGANVTVAGLRREVELSTLRPPECIICLGEFDQDNPVMYTLCACGENRTLFHYPCLLLWLEQKNSCPNCNSVLYYQVRLPLPFVSPVADFPSLTISLRFHPFVSQEKDIF